METTKTKKEVDQDYQTLDFDYWLHAFRPQTSTYASPCGFIKYRSKPVVDSNSRYSSNNLWTRISRNGKNYILSGYHTISAISYVYTEQPWNKEYIVPIF